MSRSIEDNQDISRNLQYIKFNDDIIGKGGSNCYSYSYSTFRINKNERK